MPYDQPREKKKEQRELSQQEIEQLSASTKRWSPEQLRLIWRRKIPADATIDDFIMFMYICDAKSLDPLLGEAYARLQWDSESGEKKLIVIEGIHGLAKLADQTGQLNGIKESIREDESGNVISATTTVYRKGCDFPFEATAYYSEYVARKSGGVPTKMWAEKGRVMIQKCARALALRLAFPAALAGVYVAEELDRHEPAEDEHFEVGTITEPEPAFGTHVQEAIAIVKDWAQERRLDPDVGDKQEPPAAAPPQEIPDAPDPMPVIDYKEKNRALKQRVLRDLEISPTLQAGFLSLYFKGWVGSDSLPKDPVVYTPGWEELDGYQTFHHTEARQEFIEDARALGKKMKAQWIAKQSKGENNGSNKHSEEVLPEGDESHRR